jgi:ribosomal protein S14
MKNLKSVEKQLTQLNKERAKEKGKSYGKCGSCGQKTCLVEDVGLCGPCCFGEAETINGNW